MKQQKFKTQICTNKNNTASRKLAERCGYQLDGIMRDDCLCASGKTLGSTAIYSKLRSEWKKAQVKKKK